MHYQGKVYRPWPEAESVLIQTTLGCSNNQCTFCNMFSDKRFKVRELEEIFRDIEQARRLYPKVESIFLIDGNVIAARTEFLLKIFDKITATFPEIKNIALYAGYNDLRRKTPAQLKQLTQAGLTMAYAGLESGDPEVLKWTQKGMTQEQVMEGAALAKDAGLKMLASFIFGLGGRHRSEEHIQATTDLVNQIEPEEIAPMALAIQPGTELERQVLSGEFMMPSPLQVLEEERYLLQNLNDFDCYYWGDHGNNLSRMKGMLPSARQPFLDRINQHIAHNPVTRQEVIQTFAW
ncbi:radical SAM protein [Ferrimonas sp. YFM]|uniref:B12-binding domain-containing radical SAM protein n=1 Tax=Ferrimonas sp. YFM TaxID=3028878 RepID=UPI0025731153|nr:radical SAM protein [Ferrimonas sp. YFM]BDY07025.1 radical SAM protein [Ferrimonas sp. YFM]